MQKKEFTCLGKKCPNHCCGDFKGFSDYLKSLSGISFTEIILTNKDKEILEEASLDHLIVDKGKGVCTIKTSPNGTCIALQEGECSIYENRPSICKAFPLYLDLYVGLCADKMCPSFIEREEISEYKESLKSMLDIYSFWIDYYSAYL